jgi:hypothetical protein
MLARVRVRVLIASGLVLVAACTAAPSDTLVDAGADAAAPADAGGDVVDLAFTRYPPGAVRAPITPSVVARMRAIAEADAALAPDVFLKAGASGTVSANLLYCLAGPAHQPAYALDLDGRDQLTGTLDVYRGGRIGDATPFDRDTLAAEVGRTAGWVLGGDPSPLDQEIAIAQGRLAFVNYGTNDMGAGATYASALSVFWERMHRLLDHLEELGIVAILSGLNPRDDDASAARWVPTWDAATRGLAEARQLPYLSLFEASRPLPGLGLLSDGLHGNVFLDGDGARQPCVFDATGLAFNYNVRNLESLTLLDQVHRTLVAGEPAPAAPVLPAVEGAATDDDPWRIDALSFTHTADSRNGARQRDGYPGCDAGQDESGPEQVFRLALAAETALRIVVLDREAVDVDVHLLDGETCLERDDLVIDRLLPPGDYTIVVDTFVSAGVEASGAYTLVVLACEPGDDACEA